MFRSIGKRAKVDNVHPHRLRHTFAINICETGKRVHASGYARAQPLDTVRIYLKIAQVDIDLVHRKASPVDGWRL
jgi:site-specific recombinase XerD